MRTKRQGLRHNHFRAQLHRLGCVAVIPSHGTRIRTLPYDKELYRARCGIECTFNLLKQACRFATRYQTRNYADVVAIGCALLWLRISPSQTAFAWKPHPPAPSP